MGTDYTVGEDTGFTLDMIREGVKNLEKLSRKIHTNEAKRLFGVNLVWDDEAEKNGTNKQE